MRTDNENSGRNWNALKGQFIQSFVKAYQLGYESHIGVNDWPPLLHVVKAFLVVHFLAEDQVSQANSRTSRDTLNTVHVNFAIVIPRILDEVHGIVKYTFNIFSHVVLQMIFLVTDFDSEVVG